MTPFPVSNPQVREELPDRAKMGFATLKLFSRCGMSIACCIFVFMLTMFSAASLSAQTAGIISGHVADPTGAVIPGASITLTNTATNTSRTTVTTPSGDYLFYAVPPGIYNISVTHSGFEAATTPNVEVAVQQSLQLNFTLRVGATSETVTVTAANALLQVNNTTMGTVISAQTITQMPLNGRNYLGMVALSANANTLSPTQGQAGAREGGARSNESISVGGSRIMFDHYTLDGVNNSDPDFNSFIVQPSVDAISQMKVQTGVYPAQFGYNATQVNVVTKSGGNQLHGTAFDFVRNNYADALGYDYNLTPLPAVLPYKYNDYGFVISGPVIIPHVFHGKNKFFFMANDEWYSEVNFSNSNSTLPTAAEEAGDFSAYSASNGGPVQDIYDPTTGTADESTGVTTGRTQFSCNGVENVIDDVANHCPGRMDPTGISQKFISLYYLPAATTSYTNNYQYLSHGFDKHDGLNIRGDFYQSEKSQLAFRFSNGEESTGNAGFTTSGGTAGSKIITKYYQYMGSSTYTFSPTVVNVATFGWTNFLNSLGLYSQGSDDDVAKIGIPGLSPGLPSTWGIPSMGFLGDRWSGIGDSTDGPYVTTDPDISINDNISIVRGKHSMDVGFEFERQTFNELGNQESRGSFQTNGQATAQITNGSGGLAEVSGTGDAFADFELGYLYQDTYAVAIASANYKRNVEGAYFDDSYKLTPKLSVQAGLRYELTPPWYNTLGQEFIVNMKTNSSPLYPDTWNASTAADPHADSAVQPTNEWPIHTRQGNCSNAYQGIAIFWTQGATNAAADVNGGTANGFNGTNPNAGVIPNVSCANGSYPNSLMATDNTDFAPRIGLSYSPTPTWVIRTGYGLYFDHDTANARFDMARNLAGRVTLIAGGGTVGSTAENWSNAIVQGAASYVPPPYSYAMAYDHRTTYSEVWLLDIQKQLGANWSLEAGYLGTHSNHLYGFRNPNYTIPYGYIGNGASTSQFQRTPYPMFGVIQMVDDIGVANYNALSFQVNKRFSNGFNLVSSYTFSKSLDDTSGIRTQSSQLFAQNDFCIPCEYGPSDFDVRHRVVAGVVYDLPVGQQAGALLRPSSKIVDAIVGGWQYNVVGTLQTGTHNNVSYSDDNANTNTIAGGTYPTRPNYVAGQSFFVSHKQVGSEPGHTWWNLAAWHEPAAGFLGDSGRNMLENPGVENFDMSLDKNFNMPYSEHHQLQIRFDAFNSLNHTNFGGPNTRANVTSSFGQITGSSTSARQLQLAARYTF